MEKKNEKFHIDPDFKTFTAASYSENNVVLASMFWHGMANLRGSEWG